MEPTVAAILTSPQLDAFRLVEIPKHLRKSRMAIGAMGALWRCTSSNDDRPSRYVEPATFQASIRMFIG